MFQQLLSNLTSLGTSPQLTWYAPEGERLELSASVTANWVTKATNLLVEEFDASSQTKVLIELGYHWKTIVFTLAAWQVGASVEVIEKISSPNQISSGHFDHIVVTHDEDSAAKIYQNPNLHGLIQLPLAPLARKFPGTLYPGAIDGAQDLMTYSDQLGYLPPVPQDGVALWLPGGGQVNFSELLTATENIPMASRVLFENSDPTALLLLIPRLLKSQSSLVFTSVDLHKQLSADDALRNRIFTPENITLQLS